ncbi:hypothetical protein K2173_028274 [Erythroxylum novogranatense]|uniref:PB1 domain-containing protein n=1 Tax=Erythroxylum novogranatense TaxID=1862640 RepID=A0AAV8U1D5_9ROSI|nr:hypothetical protein K2173_028274 [Erythroxylum novogranatense]
MDPPPLPPLPTTTTAPPTTIHLNYPDSVDSSPRSHPGDAFNDTLPPVPGAKLRLMCSYGGHIIPRPHDKSLCYIGGETRIVVVDRHSSLSSLCSRLSLTLLNGRPFAMKYQLPHEDLDSLVSVTTDEDLDSMIEEYDRVTSISSALAPARIRLFLFFNRPETASSMGSLLDDAKSETWFVDALNGSGLLPRNLSDSATMGCLVNLDSDHDLEAQADGLPVEDGEIKQENNGLIQPDVNATMPDSPKLETSSTSSSPSIANLPPIRVRIEDHKIGLDEQFAQMSFAQVVQRNDDGNIAHPHVAPPPIPAVIAHTSNVTSITPAGGSSEHLNRVLSDDEKSDQGVSAGFRKPPLPIQPVQHKAGTCYSLPSPDSVASDASVVSASSLSKPLYYQDQVHIAHTDSRAPASPDIKPDVSVPTSQIHLQQVQDPMYASPSQLDQPTAHQFVPAGTHFVPHPVTASVPISPYYPVYPHPSQQPLQQFDQQYPLYVMPVTQTQQYMSMQPSMVVDPTTAVPSSRPLTANSGPPIVAASAAYKDSHPPIYPAKAIASSGNPEMVAGVYRTAVAPTPSLVQVPAASQYQQQYVGYSQIQLPSQSISVAPVACPAPYGYEYANATHDQVYYSQHQAVGPLPPHYQTMSTSAAVGLADTSNPLPPSNTLQEIATSQPH